MPIGERGGEDTIHWHFDDKGRFSVKSAYLLGIGYYDGDSHTSSKERRRWGRMVWSLSVPPKVRVFAWRAFSNIIPAAGNLRSHHVPTDGIFSLCNDRWSSTEHSVLFCPRVCKLWKNSPFWDVMQRARYLTIAEIGEVVRNEHGASGYQLWVLMLLRVWSSICKVAHDTTEQILDDVEIECIALWDSYQAAQPTFSEEAKLGVEVGEKKWRRPAKGRFRVDVDVLFHPEQSQYGVGITIRDYKGEVSVRISKPTKSYSNVMIAETMAIVHGLLACMEYKVEPHRFYHCCSVDGKAR